MSDATAFSANMDRLMKAQIWLEEAERRERRAIWKRRLANIGLMAAFLAVVLAVATLVGMGLLHLMPDPGLQP